MNIFIQVLYASSNMSLNINTTANNNNHLHIQSVCGSSKRSVSAEVPKGLSLTADLYETWISSWEGWKRN